MDVTQVVWLVLLLAFLVLEAVTVSVVSIWFAAGALAALLVAIFLPDMIVAQAAAFLVVSMLALLALRPLAKKGLIGRRVPTNADANIGKMAQVVTEIQPGRFGRVKLEGMEWAAKSDSVLPVGAWCRVEAIEGVKLVVSPAQPPSFSSPDSSTG